MRSDTLRAAALLAGALLAATATARSPEKPRPSILAPLAAQSTLTDIARGGPGLVAVGDRGHILLSADGRQWRQVVAPVNRMLNRVRFRGRDFGIAVGYDAAVLVTRDGGEHWTLAHWDPEGRPLYDVLFFADGTIAAIGGYGGYYVSTDDGESWQAQDNVLGEIGHHLYAGAVLADGTAIVVGERALIARSTDAGRSWELIDSPYEGSLFGVVPWGRAGALVFGMRGRAYLAGRIAALPTVAPEDFDPWSKETIEDVDALAAMGWMAPAPVTDESLFGGDRHGDAALLVGVNGVAVRFAPKAGAMRRVESGHDQTLADAIWHDGQWIAVGRRGIQHLGRLGWE